MRKKITWFYYLIHILFWCGYAIIWSFTSVYLKACGYNSQIIGLVTGVGAMISVLLQPVLASLVEKSPRMNNSKNVVVLQLLALGMAAMMMLKLPGIYTVAVLFMMVAALEASLPSILSSIAMECVNEGLSINYGIARGLGAASFSVSSLFYGYAVSFWGENCLMMLYIIICLLVVLSVILFRQCYKKEMPIRKICKEEKKQKIAGFSLLKKYSFLKYFLISAVFLFMSHNIVCVFLPQIIENAGGDSSKLGIAIFIAAGVEFPVMSYFVRLSKKIAIDRLLVWSAIFFAIKSTIAMFAGNVALVYLAQFSQFGGFALFTPASVYFINMALKEEDRNVGQALLGACTIGLGGTFGNVIGGMILERAGLFAMVTVSTVFCIVGILLMIVCRSSYKKANLKNI